MIGIDNKLKSSATPALSPKAPSFPRVSDRKVTEANNNVLAGAYGTDRATQQKMAGRGMSSGRGHEARSERSQHDATIQAHLGAAGNDMDASQANANMALAYDTMRKGEDINTVGLLQGLSNSRQQAMLGKQSQSNQMYGENLRHNLAMDSMYLDTSPILQYLMR